MAAIENVNTPIPHVEKTAVVTMLKSANEHPTERRGRTMSGDSAQSCDQGDLEAPLPNDARQARIGDPGLFKLFSAGGTAILERTG